MSKNADVIIRKVAAAVLAITGLAAMIVAWNLLLFAGQYTTAVLAMEIGGVVLCLAGYFLWQRNKREEKDAR